MNKNEKMSDRQVQELRDGAVVLRAFLSGVEAELWEKRSDPYFLGKHDGVRAALHRLERVMESAGL